METKDLPPLSSDNSSRPPSYTRAPVDITANFAKLNLESKSTKPTVDQCIAHLKLLEAFHQLREDIATTDGLFGISDELATKLTRQDEALAKVREKRWAVYVARAADRFERWWVTCVPTSQQALRQSHVISKGNFDRIASVGRPMNITNLPPLDVLMVWHSYMLNPRCFFEDCIRYGKMDFWVTGLPWNMINSCIDNSSFDYTPSNEAMRTFENVTGLAWDNLHDGPSKAIACPKCQYKVDCPWTTPTSYSTSTGELLATGTGYADQSLYASCLSCGHVVTHDLLRIQKFRRDVQLLLKDDRPMPGTILSIEGLPQKPAKRTRHEVFFPNRLISAGLKTELLELSDTRYGASVKTEEIRRVIEDGIRNPSLIRKANDTLMSSVLLRAEKIAIRRMLAHYWDNSSIFGLDLVGAVIRQGSFVEKMHSIDWIHSPALAKTMQRLILKYDRYFSILAGNPGKVAVPTLDVDLAWHTHQLSPPQYYDSSVRTTNVFIDHDDKIDENKLSDAFEWTSKTYQKMFDDVYSECTCWYCEAIRESHHSSLVRLLNAESPSLDRLHASCPTEKCDPNKTPHISAHNAVKAKSLATDNIAAIKAAQLETSYQKARRRAAKKGRTPPARDAYMFAYTWGYPLEMVDYAPYMADPCVTDGMYAGNPACMNLSVGAPGNCAAGTCGGGVAAGACAGAAGGCAGGTAGGCGGGGGSGGGGGCGGGGGGGGCGGGGGS